MSSNYHYEVFLFQSKKKNPIKDINQNFVSNKLNEKKSEHPFVKKLIFLIDTLINFF